MKLLHWAVLWLGCLAVLGCRTDPNITLLEQELRFQEDRIYHLQDCVDQHQASLESCRRENRALRNRLESAGGGAEPGAWPGPSGSTTPPVVELPGEETPGKKTQPGEAPKAPGAPPVPKGIQGPSTLLPPEEIPLGGTATRRIGADSTSDSTRVARIAITRLLTGGYDMDGRHGDEGIATVIEPRDARGRIVAAAAPISVVLIDPELSGEPARVARWDFAADEVAAMHDKTPLGEGIHLEMPWPAAAPRHRRLHLHVRYTTADGRKLEADQEIRVELPGESPGWTVAPTMPPPRRTAVRPRRLRRAAAFTKPKRPVWSPDRW